MWFLVVFLSCAISKIVVVNPPNVDGQDLSNLLEMDLKQLGRLEVFTASRELIPIEEAPSVITIITADEIRRCGLKNIKEVLDRVPGCFKLPDLSLSLIGNLGYTQNPNNNYLLFVDGHAINSVADEGIGNTHLMPFLYQVKRIEVIRGPGSTLSMAWGGP